MFSQDFSFNPGHSASTLDRNDGVSARQASRSLSPCSFEESQLSSRYTVTDLAACFATSRLRPEAQICYDSCEAYANLDDDAGWQLAPPCEADSCCDVAETSNHLPTHLRATLSARPHISPVSAALRAMPRPSSSTSRRMQRQLQSRMLASSKTHHSDIAALMARMVDAGEQCRVASSPIILPHASESYSSSPIILPSTEIPDDLLNAPLPPHSFSSAMLVEPDDDDADAPTLDEDDDEGYTSSESSRDCHPSAPTIPSSRFSPGYSSSNPPTSPSSYSSTSISSYSSTSTSSLNNLSLSTSRRSSLCAAAASRLQYRRSADLVTTGSIACVRKSVRARKYRKSPRAEGN